jgi:hypothetical protein
VYLILYIFGKQPERQNIRYRMIASISFLQSAFNLFLNRILIHYGCSQIFELLNPFKGNIISFYIVTLLRILLSRHDRVLSFISILF